MLDLSDHPRTTRFAKHPFILRQSVAGRQVPDPSQERYVESVLIIEIDPVDSISLCSVHASLILQLEQL